MLQADCRDRRAMAQVCLVIPVVVGSTDAACDHIRTVAARAREYDRSRRRVGITKEVWHLACVDGRDVLVCYIEAGDAGRAFGVFTRSRDRFDQWFTRGLATAIGLDLDRLPRVALPELLSTYTTSRPGP
jgi:hypothetical protein